MGIFILKPNEQWVQGYQPNRSYTKAEADAKFGSGFNVEIPTGTVDGSNTTFTVSNTPKAVMIDGVIKVAGFGYTYSAPTITVSSDAPPVNFIRSLY